MGENGRAQEVAFAVGDVVSWVSQANGTWREKTGKIVEVVPPRCYPMTMDTARKYDTVNKYGGGWPRNEVSYLVLVPGPGPKSKPRLYWPRVKKLRGVSADASQGSRELTFQEIRALEAAT